MTMSMSRGHGIDLHCLSPAASPASSLDFLSLSLSVPQIHQPLLYSGPLDPSFHCLEPPLCLLLTESYSPLRSQVKHCFAQQDATSSVRLTPLLHPYPTPFPLPCPRPGPCPSPGLGPDSPASAPFSSPSSFSLEEQQLCPLQGPQHVSGILGTGGLSTWWVTLKAPRL